MWLPANDFSECDIQFKTFGMFLEIFIYPLPLWKLNYVKIFLIEFVPLHEFNKKSFQKLIIDFKITALKCFI